MGKGAVWLRELKSCWRMWSTAPNQACRAAIGPGVIGKPGLYFVPLN
jgi:hypothetical protein